MVDSHGKTGWRFMDAQVVSLLGAGVLANMRWKQSSHAKGSLII